MAGNTCTGQSIWDVFMKGCLTSFKMLQYSLIQPLYLIVDKALWV
jgi:hypothetical protein